MASRYELLKMDARANIEPALSELLGFSSEEEIRDLMVSEGIKGVPWSSCLDPISMFLDKGRRDRRFRYETDLIGLWGTSPPPRSGYIKAFYRDGGEFDGAEFRIADFAGALFSFWRKFENEEYPELVDQDLFERMKRVTGFTSDIQNSNNIGLEA